MTLTEFLLARIAEDESVSRGCLLGDPGRVRAECEAKQLILGEHPDYGGYGEYCATCVESDIDNALWPCPTLKALALPYADHPDYDEKWRP